jgi:hypothetical protein
VVVLPGLWEIGWEDVERPGFIPYGVNNGYADILGGSLVINTPVGGTVYASGEAHRFSVYVLTEIDSSPPYGIIDQGGAAHVHCGTSRNTLNNPHD